MQQEICFFNEFLVLGNPEGVLENDNVILSDFFPYPTSLLLRLRVHDKAASRA